METRPEDLPELRAAMLEWYGNYGQSYFSGSIRSGAQRLYISASSVEEAARWYSESEAARLRSADLYWVSRDMTELCVSAARSMPEWSLAPEDMPSPNGLIVFEGLPEFREFATTAMTWGTCPRRAVERCGLKGPGIWLSHYGSASLFAELLEADGHDLSTIPMPLPPLLYESESLAAFGRRESDDVAFFSQNGEDFAAADDTQLTARASSLVVIKAAWLLMQQGIADSHEVLPDRACRKRLARAGQEPKAVRVIELRRPKTSSGHGDGDREYHHQWIVRGHWRQQWHPKREVHRPVWIAPHIKGPEGAPLIGGEKVYAWKR